MKASLFHILTTLFAIMCFVTIAAYKFYKGEKVPLSDLISLSLTASTMPTGGLLVLCAFDTSLIKEFEGLGVFLAIAGLTLLYSIVSRIKSGLQSEKELIVKEGDKYE